MAFRKVQIKITTFHRFAYDTSCNLSHENGINMCVNDYYITGPTIES